MGNLISTTPSVKDTIIRRTSREDETAIRNSKAVITSIEAVRNYPDTDCPEAKAVKAQNYYSCPQAHIPDGQSWTYRKNENFIPSGKVILDYDNHGDWQTFMDKIKDRFEELNFLHIERSCRDGIHAIVPRIEGLTINETITWYEKAIGLKLDHNTKDVARACFLVPESFVIYDTDEYYKDFVAPQIREIPEDFEYDNKPMMYVTQQEYIPEFTEDMLEGLPSYEDMKEAEYEKLLNELADAPEDNLMNLDLEAPNQTVETGEPPENYDHHAVKDEYHREYENDWDEVEHICEKYIIARGIDTSPTEPEWFAEAVVIASILGPSGRDLFHRISQYHPRYNPRETDSKYTHVLNSGYNRFTLGTLIYLCRQYGAIRPTTK